MTEQIQENQPDSPQTPVVAEKKKVDPLTIVILLIVILLAGVGGVYAGMQLSKKQTPVILPTAPPQEIRPTEALPTSISDETANWKTYNGDEFSFKYPSEWYIFSYEETPEVINWGFSTKPVETKVGPIENLVGIVVFLTQTPLEQLKSSLVSEGEKNEGKLTINNKNAVRLSYKGIDGSDNARVAIDLNGKTLVFSGSTQGSEKIIFDQILSTFKFLDQSETKFTCPQNGWVDCMPILDEAKKLACSSEAEAWYKINCPDFKGLAQ